MSKAITKKKSVSIRGVLEISKADNQIFVCVEDGGEAMPLADILQDFDNAEVSMSVTESVDIA